MNSPAGLQGWLMDLQTAPGNGVSSGNGTTNAAQPWQSGANGGTGGTGAALLVGARGGNFGFPAAGTNDLITFTLSRSFNTGDLSAADVFVRLPVASTNFYNGLLDDFEVVSFGNNAGVYADNGASAISYANAVIRIQNVPEPSSLLLLALGGVAALRRRRSA